MMIAQERLGKSMYDEFIEMPMGKRNTGSARLYKKKNRYSCMIQITGHVPNNREDIPHEEFHEFIRAVHINLKAKIRRKYDMALVCESDTGNTLRDSMCGPNRKWQRNCGSIPRCQGNRGQTSYRRRGHREHSYIQHGPRVFALCLQETVLASNGLSGITS